MVRIFRINLIEPHDTVHDVDCSFDDTYVMIGKHENRSIKHELRSRICIEESDILQKFNFKNIFYQRIKNHCTIFLLIYLGKIFTSFVFIKTYIFVAHGNLLSFYDVLKQKWIKHIPFDEDVIEVFRQADD